MTYNLNFSPVFRLAFALIALSALGACHRGHVVHRSQTLAHAKAHQYVEVCRPAHTAKHTRKQILVPAQVSQVQVADVAVSNIDPCQEAVATTQPQPFSRKAAIKQLLKTAVSPRALASLPNQQLQQNGNPDLATLMLLAPKTTEVYKKPNVKRLIWLGIGITLVGLMLGGAGLALQFAGILNPFWVFGLVIAVIGIILTVVGIVMWKAPEADYLPRHSFYRRGK